MNQSADRSEPILLGYFGHHKCGSTWIYHVLSDVAEQLSISQLHAHGAYAFERDLSRFRLEQGFDLITYVNANYHYVRDLEVRGVHVVRDPRDLLVSAYFSHRNSHPTDGWSELEELRQHLRRVPEETGLLLEMEFCSGVLNDLDSWPDQPPGILRLRFEEMIESEHIAFRTIASHLGLLDRIGEDTLAETVDRWSFESLTGGRKRGHEDTGHHFRKGVAGDWRNHFTPAITWAFKQRHNDLLLRYGYEANNDW